MTNYQHGALIPCSVPSIFCMFRIYKMDHNIKLSVKGRPIILSTSTFLSAVNNFKTGKNRAIGKADMCAILKDDKVEVARKKKTLP